MNIFAIILIVIHILLSVFTFLGAQFKFLHVHKYMFFVVLCLPFWGFLAVMFLHFEVVLKQDDTIAVGVQKMKLDSVLYKGITVEEKKNDDSLVAIEEALLINSPKERREIIMDVLNDNPKEYIEFLQKAGNNEDPEVVHYAVTAMVEISKENDYVLQKLGREYAKNPDDIDVLTRYCDFLWIILEQNLLSGQVELMNRNLYSQLVSKKLAAGDNMEDYIRYFENEFALGNYTIAGEVLSKADALYDDSEDIILLKLKYYAQLKQGDKIKELLKDIQSKKMFVSRRVKEAIAFWKS
ncbi:MAG: hypothetical protein E7400_01555 [Ruminococcaceae bacterium]|nr:hypothetical protein [Oscillospiraceae bacterium]